MTKSKLLFFLLVIFLVVQGSLNLSLLLSRQSAENKIENLKLQLDQAQSQIYERQLKYEEEKSISDRLGKELVDAQNRLEKAAERERAARVRASRSRSVGGSRTTVKRDSTSSSMFRGGLRDITMYCPTGNRTASGKWPARGMVATLSRTIPFGTRISIEGLGEYVVEDRIGHSSEFDIFTPSCGEARRFGRRHLRVTILDTE